MKKLGLLFTMMVGAFMLTTNVMGQTNTAGEAVTYSIEAMAILDIESPGVTLAFSIPDNAGKAIADATADGGWVNYTSVIANLATNKVTAQIATGGLAKLTALGTELAITAGTAIATLSDGDLGVTAGSVTLTETALPLITAIGSCYTGNGADQGHQLSYVWSITDYAAFEVEALSSDITVTLTIIDSAL